MENDQYMWVLDFEEGTPHQYDVTDIVWNDEYTHEDFLREKKHNAKNCEWMITSWDELHTSD